MAAARLFADTVSKAVAARGLARVAIRSRAPAEEDDMDFRIKFLALAAGLAFAAMPALCCFASLDSEHVPRPFGTEGIDG